MRTSDMDRPPDGDPAELQRTATVIEPPRRAPKRRRAARKTAPETAFREENLAHFVPTEIAPADAEMWPAHVTLWLHPELNARVPESSGLHIERRHKVPAPDFVTIETSPHDRAVAIEENCQPLAPQTPNAFPSSDLMPMGWDPRILINQKGETE